MWCMWMKKSRGRELIFSHHRTKRAAQRKLKQVRGRMTRTGREKWSFRIKCCSAKMVR